MSTASSFGYLTLTKNDLKNLDETLKNANIYETAKYRKIDSLKLRYDYAGTAEAKISAALDLGREYESFNADSSYVYYDKAYLLASDINDRITRLNARISRFKALAVAGLYNEAENEMQFIENEGVPDTLRNHFYDCARQLYYYMTGYAQSNNLFSNRYFAKNRHYRDLLLEHLDPADPLFSLYYSEYLQDQGKIIMARDVLLELIKDCEQGTAFHARVMSLLANLASVEGKTLEAAHYMALSAISDIKCAIKENVSLQNLSLYLYSSGDIDRAYRYISISMSDANFCNARLRNMQIAKNMPLIDQAYKSRINAQKTIQSVVLAVVSFLAVILVIALFMLYKQMNKLRVIRYSLKQANAVRDEYMSRFLDLCSIYMDRFEKFNKLVTRKISTGQIDDLVKMTKSAKFAEEHNKLFYDNFDNAFLNIYPNFVEDFNALLLPEERINVKQYGHLTMELRIFAFLRMGVDDSNKIASFLRYSVNTVYTYRNKIKSKAINRETFDDDIMKIGVINDEKI